ncbi:MAG: serine protease [Gammaproteobacteria bacterium]
MRPRLFLILLLWLVFLIFPGGGFSAALAGATATGIVLDNRSHVLTNYHVIEGCGSVMLRHGDLVMRAHPGKYDRLLDLAILVPEKSFPAIPASFRNTPPAAGERIVIAGFPKEVVGKGLLKAVSAEIVTVNSTTPRPGMMRLSVGLNQGASGGPVLDSSGRVIGLVSGLLVNSRDGKPVEAPGVALGGDRVQRFLHRAGIDFRQGKERPANIASIAKRAASQVVKIECSGRRD